MIDHEAQMPMTWIAADAVLPERGQMYFVWTNGAEWGDLHGRSDLYSSN